MRQRILTIASAAFAVSLFSLAAWRLTQEFQQYPPQQIWHSLLTIPTESALVAAILVVLNYGVLTSYDTLAVRFVKQPLPYRQTALVAVTSYGLSNSIGFTLLSSSAIRYRFYLAWGLSPLTIARIIVFCNLSFWVGVLTLCGVVFLTASLSLPAALNLPFQSLQAFGSLCLAIILAYLGWNALSQQALQIGRWRLPHVPMKLALVQVAVTSLDWVTEAAILYILLPPLPLTLHGFVGVYVLGQLAGIFSHVPGGLGVFETVLLLLLSPPLPADALLASLLAFRTIYYGLPLLAASVLLGSYELRRDITRG